MLSSLLMFALSTQCVVEHLHYASGVEIVKPFKIKTSKLRASKRHLTRLYSLVLKEHGSYDPRYFALAWMESRLRPNIRRGDKGKACGIFQIHARYSYPMFRRKRGFNGWDEHLERLEVARECAKLDQLPYSVETLSHYLELFDDRDLPSCHHNSGIKGNCNEWYEARVNYWESYFSFVGFMCDERIQKWL